MNAKNLLKRKSARIAFAIFSILFSVYCIHGFVVLVRQMHTRDVAAEFVAANDQLQKSPPGVARAELFVKRLKAIDVEYAPPEMKQALQDYISGMEQGLEAMKAGRNTSQYDAEVADAKQRMIACVKKYD
jgi:hypothetical protein